MSNVLTIQDAIHEIEEEFAFMPSWQERFQYIIELGKNLPPLPEEFKTKQYKVDGCVSQAWLRAEMQDGRVVYQADSDAVIVRGLIALLLKVYSNHTPEEILAAPPDFLVQLGIVNHLTPNRSNGLASLVQKMRAWAAAFQQKVQEG
ncbi:MAG: SufE family protein [Candidatus Sumerlaeia bacterium]